MTDLEVILGFMATFIIIGLLVWDWIRSEQQCMEECMKQGRSEEECTLYCIDHY